MTFFFFFSSYILTKLLPSPCTASAGKNATSQNEGKKRQCSSVPSRLRFLLFWAQEHPGGDGDGGRSHLPCGRLWVLPCGERRSWPASLSLEGEAPALLQLVHTVSSWLLPASAGWASQPDSGWLWAYSSSSPGVL